MKANPPTISTFRLPTPTPAESITLATLTEQFRQSFQPHPNFEAIDNTCASSNPVLGDSSAGIEPDRLKL